MRYVALLGSVSVDGHRLTMAELREALESEGLTQVETVVSSLNLLFSHEERPSLGLEEKLQLLLRARLGMRTMAAVRNMAEVEAAIALNPFAAEGDAASVQTMFLDRDPDPAQFRVLVADQADFGPERLETGHRALYIDSNEAGGASRLTAPFIERRLQCRATGRTLRDLARIAAKMDEK